MEVVSEKSTVFVFSPSVRRNCSYQFQKILSFADSKPRIAKYNMKFIIFPIFISVVSSLTNYSGGKGKTYHGIPR